MKAEKYYEKAVKLGDSFAILELGDLYWSDDDKMNNIEKARECYGTTQSRQSDGMGWPNEQHPKPSGGTYLP